jgi:hypothetical protein
MLWWMAGDVEGWDARTAANRYLARAGGALTISAAHRNIDVGQLDRARA